MTHNAVVSAIGTYGTLGLRNFGTFPIQTQKEARKMYCSARAWRGVLLPLVIGGVIAACASSSGAAISPSRTSKTMGGNRLGAALSSPKKHVTLTIMDTGTDPGTTAQYKALIKIFEREHPNVTVKREPESFSSLISSIKLTLSSPNPPDVIEGNQGQSVDGTLVRAHLIRPLDKWSALYGWNKIWPRAIQASNLFSANGKSFGIGELWGISPRAEIVGVYYSKPKLRSLGASVPTTFKAFTALLAKAKLAGQVPIMLGDADNYTAGHVFMELIDHYEKNPGLLRDWVYGRTGATFVRPSTIQAASTLQAWARAGYFESGVLGVKDADAQARFARGEGLFMITGSWLGADFQKAMGDNVGFFPLPGDTPRSPTYATGALSPGMHISAKSKNPNVAAQWLNLLASAEGAKAGLKTGQLPGRPISPLGVDPKSVLASLVTFNKRATEKSWKVPYLDWATATMGNTLFPGLQDLIAQRLSPSALVKRVQSDWMQTYH
jgi:raffinose/stachyose/melibiose transport system substrate-binding protein